MSAASTVSLGHVHSIIAGLSTFRACMLAFVCGVSTLFCFAPFNVWPIYILSITLLVWLIDGARVRPKWGRHTFSIGFWFGAGFVLSTMHWIAAPFLKSPEQHLIFIWMPLILFPAGLGLFFGAAGFLTGILWSNGPARILGFVVAFSVMEFLRGSLFGGFPWNWPGMIWVPGQPMSQLASLFGIFGLSVLTLFLSSAPAALADFRKSSAALDRLLPLCVTVIGFAIAWGWGSQRLSDFVPDDYLAVRMIDVQVDQNEKYPGNREAQLEANRNILVAYLEAMGDDFPDEPRIVVWPEAALPFPLLQSPDAMDAVSARLGYRTLIAGTIRIDRYGEDGSEYYNSLAILTGNSSRRGALAIYDKHRLVPFGELAAADFIPFGTQIANLLPSAMQSQAVSGFSPGLSPRPMELPSGEKILPLICYEGIFSALTTQNTEGVDLLVNISVDSWFGNRIGPEQHFSNVSYRSIESGLPMIRATNLGVSRGLGALGQTIEGTVVNKTYNGWTVEVRDILLPLNKTSTFILELKTTLVWCFLVFVCIIAAFGRKHAGRLVK